MSGIKSAQIMAICLIVLACVSTAYAGTITFENMPQTYWINAGNQDIGGYWDGITVGNQAGILEKSVYGYNSVEYPPQSGDSILYASNVVNSVSDFNFDIIFDNSVNYFSFYYYCLGDITFNIITKSGDILNQTLVLDHKYSPLFFSFSSANSDIIKLSFFNNGYTSLVIDDFTSPITSGSAREIIASTVPEPSSAILLSIGLIVLSSRVRRKF